MPRGERTTSTRRGDRAARRRAAARERRARRSRRTSGRPPLPLLALGAVAAVGLAFGGTRLLEGDEAEVERRPRPLYTDRVRSGSEPVPARGALGFDAVPRAYDITYSVEDHAGGRLVRSTYRVRVRRPFESRVETRRGAPPGRGEASVQVSTFGRISFLGGGGAEPSSVVVPPYTAGSDLRVDVVADDLVEAGVLVRREQREVAGRRCQVYRSAKELGLAELDRIERGATTFVDTCVDRRGLVLEQASVEGRRLLRRQVAVEVDDRSRLPDRLFPLGPEQPEGRGLGSVLEVRTTSRSIGPFYDVGFVPAGFAEHRRYAVVPPQPQVDELDPEAARNARVAGTYDVWRRGADLLLVDQSGSLGRGKTLDLPAGAERVEVPGVVGDAAVVLDPRMAEVRIIQPRGRYIRVMGTIPPDELLAVARSLRLTEGTGLEYLEAPPGSATSTTGTAEDAHPDH